MYDDSCIHAEPTPRPPDPDRIGGDRPPRLRWHAGVIQTIGSVGGWLTLAVLPLVGLALVWWRRQLARTRKRLRLLHAQQAEVAGAAARAAGVAPPAGPGTLSRNRH
jgi:hypothetical protein